jgi:hypothetical protein
MLPRWVALLNYPHLALDHYSPAGHPTLTAPSLEEPFCAFACYCRGRTCTCVCGVLPQHIRGPIGCEHLVVVGLTRKEADTMTLRGYKSRKSTRPERVLLLQLPC